MSERVLRRFVTSDGAQLAFDDTGGAGVPLVMLHGWGQSRAMFAGQRDGMRRARRIITVDFRGHGESPDPGHGYRIARLAMDVRELLDGLDLPRVDLLGWSMGASVIWSYLDLFGADRVRSAIFVDQPSTVIGMPWMSPDERDDTGAILDGRGLWELAAGIRADATGETVREFVRGMFSGDPAPEVWDFVRDEVVILPRRRAAALLIDHAMQDWRDLLPRVSIPTLIIGCEGSHVSPRSQRFIADLVPGSEIVVFPADVARSHFPFLENPPAFNAVVSEFLERRGDGAPSSTADARRSAAAGAARP